MKSSALIAVGALLIGSVGGYIVGNSGSETGEKAEVQKAADTKSARPGRISSSEAAGSRASKTVSSFEQAMREDSASDRLGSMIEYYANLDASDFSLELKKLRQLPRAQRILATNLLFTRWAELDPEGALEGAQQLGAGGFEGMFDRMIAQSGAYQGWASTDPAAAAAYLAENSGGGGMMGRGMGGQVEVIGAEWAKKDPAAALAWAQGLAEGEGRDAGRQSREALQGIFRQLAMTDPGQAAELAAGLDAEARSDAYRSLAQSWAVEDWGATEAWINTLSGVDQDTARAEAVSSLASVDLTRAMSETLKLPSGEQRDGIVGEMSERLARQDPAAALDWLMANGGAEAQQGSVDDVMQAMAGQNPDQAMEWINQQNAGELRDSAVAGYLQGNRDGAISDSVALAETISNQDQRDRSLTRVAFQWMRDDADAAKAYVESSTALSDGARDRMIQMSERMAEGGGDFRGFGRGGPGGGRGR